MSKKDEQNKTVYLTMFEYETFQADRRYMEIYRDQMMELKSQLDDALKELKKIHDTWEQNGDAKSRYAHEVRAILRKHKIIPMPYDLG